MAITFAKTASVIAVICLMTVSSLPVKKRSVLDDEAEVKMVMEGSRLVLDCFARGGSPIAFHWLHDGHLVSQSPLDLLSENVIAPTLPEKSPGFLMQAKGQLVVPQVSEHHSGKYTCVADTGEERQTQSFTVEVEPNKSDTEPVEDELRIYQITTKVGETEGNPAYFTCRATQGINKATPQVKWSLGGNLIENDVENGVIVHSNGDLQLSHITAEYHIMNNSLVCIAYGEGKVVESDPVWVYVFESEK